MIGAGAAGLTAAGGLARLGLRVALVERGRMGGECLNTGCVPSKALLAAAHRAHTLRGTALGVTGGEPGIDFPAIRAHVANAIAAIAPHDSEERFTDWGVDIHRGHASFTARRSIAVDGRPLAAPRIILATGSDPAHPAIPGLDETPHLTNETIFALDTLPPHLLVLGAGPVGTELAQAFRRLGAAVTLVAAGPLLPREDPEATALLRHQLLADGITLHEHTDITRVAHAAGAIRLRTAAGGALTGTHLLLATGRQPRTEGLGLDRAGIEATPDGITVDARRRTTNRHVYAIGDCRAGPRFTHAAGYEGALLVAALGFGLPAKASYGTLPAVTYTEPNLARIGLTEAEARTRHPHVTTLRQDFTGNDRAVAEGDTTGFLKLVRAGRRVVGVTIVGPAAGDLLLPWTQLMARKASLWSLSGAVVAYPTRSEVSKAAAFAAYEPALFGKPARTWAKALAGLRAILSR